MPKMGKFPQLELFPSVLTLFNMYAGTQHLKIYLNFKWFSNALDALATAFER
jgi:hypothetical protein